jgi:hypothetical protein
LDDFINLQIVVEVELNPRVVFEHAEADRVLAADKLLLRIDANIKMVKKQIVVGPVPPVLPAQDVGVRWCRGCWRRAGALLRLGKQRHRGRQSKNEYDYCLMS